MEGRGEKGAVKNTGEWGESRRKGKGEGERRKKRKVGVRVRE